MSRLMFVYLSGTEKGKSRIFAQDQVTVGTSDSADLKLVPEEGGHLPDGILADIHGEDGLYQLVARHPRDRFEILVNGEALPASESAAGHTLHDGDTLHFGHGLSSASLLFQVMPENFSTTHPVRREAPIHPASDQPTHPHPLTATLFVKELASSLWAEIPRRAKLSTLGVVGFLTALFVAANFYYFITSHRTSNEIERLRQQMEAEASQRQQDKDLIAQQRNELDRLRQLSEQTTRLAQNVAERYSTGVCLVVGSYSFVEHGTGRLLRYESADNANEVPVDASGNLLASVDGAGPAVQLEFSGTGFVVEDGLIATNKHVVQPWASDPTAQLIMRQGGGFKPRLDSLVAFFPPARAPYELRVARASDRYDIALCSFPPGDATLPALPLGHDDLSSIMIGEPVVLLGYPTGVDGLLQRIDEGERRAIQSEHGRSVEDVARGLASRGLIRPLTTTGIISDALPGRVVHSAHTTEGGSGGPLFDPGDRVIAINSAILASTDNGQSFGGSNFGVPIRAVIDLLQAYHLGEAKQ